MYIIELAGLPGTGKTTICDLLNKHYGVEQLFFINRFMGSRYRYLISLPLALLTVGKFYRIFMKLIWFNTTREMKRRMLLNDKVDTSCGHSFMEKSKGRTIISVLSTLHIWMMKYWLAVIEASARRKKMMLDGGFVQHGISLWLRAPAGIRDDIWREYLSHIPRGVQCIVLQCDPAEALRRAKMRPMGLPEVFRRRASSGSREAWLMEQYRQISDLLSDEPLATRVKYIYVSAEMSIEKVVDRIVAEVEDAIPLRDLIVQ